MTTFLRTALLISMAYINSSSLFAQGEALHVDASGNVGIGTAIPTSPLQIDRDNNVSTPIINLRQTIPSWGSQEIFNHFRYFQTNFAGSATDGAFKQFNVGAGGVSIGYANVPIFASPDALYINGNVGIGTTSLTHKLTVNGSALFGMSDNTALGIDARDGASLGFIKKYGYGPQIVASTGQPIIFSQTNQDDIFKNIEGATLTERMRINGNGNIGIGMNNPLLTIDTKADAKIGTSVTITELNNPDNRGDKISFGSFGASDKNGFAGMKITIAPGTRNGGNSADIIFNTWEHYTDYTREVVRINGSGNVGIGTATPNYRLDVMGGLKSVFNNSTQMSKQVEGDKINNKGNGTDEKPISIRTDGGILCSYGLYVTSDKRIKKTLTVADTYKDLLLVNNLKVTSFQYKNTITNGKGFNKGFIAQEVEEVYPQAVNKSTDFIPSIYAMSDNNSVNNNVLTVNLKAPHQLITGDVVRLVTEKNETKEVAVTVLNDKSFTVNKWDGNANKLFVFGKKVNDFRSVDYQQIFSLGISAIQELSKQVDLLKAENKKMQEDAKSISADFQTKFSILDKKIEALKGANAVTKK